MLGCYSTGHLCHTTTMPAYLIMVNPHLQSGGRLKTAAIAVAMAMKSKLQIPTVCKAEMLQLDESLK